MPEREIKLTQKEVVRHFVFRLGAINGYRFGPGGSWSWAGQSPSNRKEQLEALDANRRQYVHDMRQVKEAVHDENEPSDLTLRFAALNGYRFGPDRGWVLPGHKPTNRKQLPEAVDDKRRQYVNDMRWVREAVRLKLG